MGKKTTPEQKQRLLDPVEYQKQLAIKKQQAALERQQAAINAKMQALQKAATPEPEVKPEKTQADIIKQRIIVGVLALLILYTLPYPQLIKYEKLKIVTESVYIPSYLGITDGFILDSYGDVSIQGGGRWMYICNQVADKNNCQRYQVIERKGFFAALKKLLS
ncbi:hypothetical protein C2869_20030 [Saccharobesus litoralis]|uniref:Uncharacterized protein n=1 Tax=Saccharobesus litoralis TaxID=2172099 RepID=A0A2S0VWF5_9ALTE|nr:hypothetical protein [Saccharobesus litoralis]AWB68548.1 hypothetical protein C2869_20030 [Saccharobesus litoralis]